MGDIILSGGSSGGSVSSSVSITDGDSSVKADVLDLTNSNPLTVAIVDTNGDQISSFGGGTQYTEDAALPADPVGTAIAGRMRGDPTVSEGIAEGDAVTINASDRGHLYTYDYAADVNSQTSIGLLEDISNSLAPTGVLEDSPLPADPTVTIIGARYRTSVASEGVADGDVIGLNSTINGELFVSDNTAQSYLSNISADVGFAYTQEGGPITDGWGALVRVNTSPGVNRTGIDNGEAIAPSATKSGELHVAARAVVSDVSSTNVAPGNTSSLSLTPDGRLRVDTGVDISAWDAPSVWGGSDISLSFTDNAFVSPFSVW